MINFEKWQTLNSKYIVDDRWLKLRADACKTPTGDILEPYYVFEYPDWITCLAIDGNEAVMIRQYRHGAGEYVLELIAGGVETHDNTPSDTAKRELREEIGYSGGAIYQTGVSYANPANQTNKIYCFVAVGGTCNIEQSLEVGESIYIERMPIHEVFAKMTSSNTAELFQSFHITSLLFAQNFIRSTKTPDFEELRRLVS